MVRIVKKFPINQDAQHSINNLIFDCLTNKNSRPIPLKIFIHCRDWTKVDTKKKLFLEPISYKTLLQLNIWLGLYNVLETGSSNLSLNTLFNIDSFNFITASLDNWQGNLSCIIWINIGLIITLKHRRFYSNSSSFTSLPE